MTDIDCSVKGKEGVSLGGAGGAEARAARSAAVTCGL